MAKKSSSKKDKISFEDMSLIADILGDVMNRNGISPEDIMRSLGLLSETGLAGIYDQFYDYKKPDYAKMLVPLHPAIEPIVKKMGVIGISEMIKDALQQLKGEDADTAGKALINAVYYIIANHKELRSEGDYTNIPLFAILHLMVELNVKDATPALIELVNQDGDFYTFFIDVYEEEMSFAISQLCKADLKALEDFMYVTGRIPNTKCIVADGVIHMALTDPMLRISVIAWLARVLQRYSEIVVYEANIDHITNSIAQLKAPELSPLIEKLYATKNVPFIEIANKRELKKLLGKGTDEHRILTESLADVIAQIEEKFLAAEDDEPDYDLDEDEDDFWDDYDFDYEDEDEEDEDDEDLLVYDNEDGLLYRLEITLNGSPVEVTRELIVPSNIRLNWLGKVLMATMGWEGYHLNQFIKGKECYTSVEDIEDAWDNAIDYTKYALNDILSRKGSKIQWEYDLGDSWMHTVKLIEKVKYDGKMPLIEATKAVNACPPEDCGGVWGYAEMLEALKDKNDPEHDSWKEWVGPRFNPNKVSLKKINTNLKPFLKQI